MSYHIVATRCSTNFPSMWGDLVAVELVKNTVEASCVVGPRGCCDKTGLNGVKFVERGTWVLYKYVSGYT